MMNYHRMSPALREQCMRDDADYAAAVRATEAQRARRAERVEEQNLQLAMRSAWERGEQVSPAEVMRTGGACLARTPSEAAAYHWAMAEAQEAREAARSATAPTEEDLIERHSMMIALDPRLGRTRSEAIAYYSALGDLQEIEAARTAALAKSEAEKTAREKLDAKYQSRAREKHLHTVARAVAQGEIAKDRERRAWRLFGEGRISEEQYVEGEWSA